MGDRTLLGPADVTDDQLAAMVSAGLGVADAQLSTCQVEVAAYDLHALTTAARYWVRGTARHAGGESPYAFFVKVVQSWTRTPQFQYVPEHLREMAAAGVKWRTEPTVYRSDLSDRLPAGLSLPRVGAVIDIDDESAALWLEAVDADPASWDPAAFERAAYLLGRLAASDSVRPLGTLGSTGVARGYAEGRLGHQVLPALRGDALWSQPFVAEAFGPELRARLLAAADSVPALLDELDGAQVGIAHGDACTRNLLRPRDARSELVLIDFAFWCQAPLGFDLTQLLLGEIQLGERPAAELALLDDLCVTAYVRGLQEEGCSVSPAVVRRTHALLMLLFWGLSAVPVEVLYGAPAPRSGDVLRERATAAEFVLELVDATSAT